MITQLLFMRHAKSSWRVATLPDHARPLNGRGRRDAPRMARHLVQEEHLPTLILSSDSRRTQQTVALMLAWWAERGDALPEVRWSSALYEASGEQLIGVLARTLEELKNVQGRVMLLGHNPGMEDALASLTGQRVTLTTGNIAALERGDGLEVPWRLKALWRPREI